MTTEARIEANRRNAELSTGPRTAQGKAIASRNAVTHGLLSEEAWGDDGDDMAEPFAEAMRAELAPVGELEALYADRAIANAWRLRRAMRIERLVLREEEADAADCSLPWEPRKPSKAGGALGLAFIRDCNGAGAIEKLSRYEAALERGMFRALHELERLQAARAGRHVPVPAVLDVDVNMSHAEGKADPSNAA